MSAINDHIARDGFRLRGEAMSRIDGFSDVVFGFALTLIVVSLEVPRTYDELHAVLLGFIPFAICFCFLIWIWWAHFRFFRRYGLHDAVTITLNSMLLFTVLFYFYPLKFLFTLFIGQFTGQVSGHVFSNAYQQGELMVVYGGGFAAIYLIYAVMYWNAWRQRLELKLNPLESAITVSSIWNYLGLAGIGVLCCVIVFLLPSGHQGYAGYAFWLVGVWKTLHGFISGSYVRRARERTTPDEGALLTHSI